MENIVLASHNSFTHLPVKWYMGPFNFMSRCQSKTVKEQFEDYGVRIFDMRVSFDKEGIPHIKHGFMDYGVVNNLTLEWLDEKAKSEKVYIRVILEKSKWNCTEEQESLFSTYCAHLEGTYRNILFTEGRRKYDWKQLFQFKNSTPSMEADFASVKGGLLNDLWPRLYARKHNRKAIENCKAKYLMLDFVEIR